LPLSPLTEKDLSDLDFVATHADIIGYSFVQRPADIELLQQELDRRLVKGQSRPAIVAEAIAILDDVLTRMEAHQSKKTPQLRARPSW
jgi:pyruvate kinase